jgi:hypothetical protein
MTRITIGPTSWKPADQSLGGAYEGGYLICCSGGTLWIVAPGSTEVSRNWFARDDAVTTANANAACGDWFVPTFAQLLNPGYTCRTYWDEYSNCWYWSSTERDVPGFAWMVNFTNGSNGGGNKPNAYCVRAFRCVTY